jgi:hypothetical protein
LAALGLLASTPPPATSQTVPSPYAFVDERQEVGLFAGYLSAGTGRFGFGLKGGPMYGARYAVDLSGPLSLEGSVGVVDGTRDVVSPSRPEGNRVVGQADIVVTMMDARLRLSATGARAWRGLTPFIVVGAGLAYAPDKRAGADALLDADEVFDFGTKFIGTAGPGVRWLINRHLALRADAGLSVWQLTTPSGFGDPTLGLQNVAESQWVSGLSATASLLFRW